MSSRLKLDDNIRFRRVADEGVVVDQRSAEIMVVTEVAVRTLELIQETGDLDRVHQGIVSEFDVSDERARVDLEAFLAELESRQMLAWGKENVR
jgi:hypothetical protein